MLERLKKQGVLEMESLVGDILSREWKMNRLLCLAYSSTKIKHNTWNVSCSGSSIFLI